MDNNSGFEANNDTYCLQKRIEKFPLFYTHGFKTRMSPLSLVAASLMYMFDVSSSSCESFSVKALESIKIYGHGGIN